MYSTTLDQIRRITEGDKRLMVWIYWRESPYAHAASCNRYKDDDDVWEGYVGMMEVDRIEDLEPDSWGSEDAMCAVYPCPQRKVEREVSAISQCDGF